MQPVDANSELDRRWSVRRSTLAVWTVVSVSCGWRYFVEFGRRNEGKSPVWRNVAPVGVQLLPVFSATANQVALSPAAARVQSVQVMQRCESVGSPVRSWAASFSCSHLGLGCDARHDDGDEAVAAAHWLQ